MVSDPGHPTPTTSTAPPTSALDSDSMDDSSSTSRDGRDDDQSDVELVSDGNTSATSDKGGEKSGGDNSASDNSATSSSAMRACGSATPKTPSSNNRPPTSSSSSSSKKRKRLTSGERLSREKEQAEKRQKLEEERIRKEEEKRRKEQERQDKLKAKEQEKRDKDRQKEQERLERERVKEQERVKKEEERKKRDEAKEQERVKKEQELAKKAEEKKKREDERLKKEEEKRKQQEEKDRERQKAEEKRAKQASSFTKFFLKSPAPTKVKTLTVVEQPTFQRKTSGSLSSSGGDVESDKENSNDVPSQQDHTDRSNRMKTEVIEPSDDKADIQIVCIKKPEAEKFSPFPFQIKSNMAVAPLIRRNPLNGSEREYLEKVMEAMGLNNDESGSICFLSDLTQRAKMKQLRKSGRTLIQEDEEEEEETDKDIKIIMQDVIRPSEGCVRYRKKLLQFWDNRRPAYWGTWKRKATRVKAVKPLAKETDMDYEFDSDDEWEDEPDDAEEIENSDGEEEAEDAPEGEPLDEEDEDGWMVPHGYLSDNERDGEGAEDLEVIKLKEKEFFKSLKEQVKLGLPVIQTEKLSDFKMIFPPARSRKIRHSTRTITIRKSDDYPRPQGFLGMDLPSDEEGDMDWQESCSTPEDENEEKDRSSNSDDESTSSNDEEFEDDDEEDIKCELEGYPIEG